MQIPKFKSPVDFKGATININALSDTHGQIDRTDCAYSALMDREKDAFEKEEKGKKNYVIIGGDWFISGNEKGFHTDPNRPLMKFQGEMLNKFIGKIKSEYPKTTTLFIPGNHDFDGGTELFSEAVKDTDAKFIMSNLDFEKSDAIKDSIQSGHAVKSSVDFIEDDKDPALYHPVLNLGVIPINLEFYEKNHKGIDLIEENNTPQKEVKPEQFEITKQKIKDETAKFKKEYPNGTVILTCHTGVNFADECAKDCDIDLIFDGHEHKNNVRIVNKTPIAALSQNFRKIVNAKIKLDDEGKIESISLKNLYPLNYSGKKGELGEFYDKMFEEDSKKLYTIKSTDGKTKTLDTDGIRTGNSNLANFVCDILLEKTKQIDDSIQIFALNSSSIRGGFDLGKAPNVSPFEVISCLNGININDSDIYVAEVSGKELAYLVLDNLMFNRRAPEKNTLIQYSGIKVNRTGLIADYLKNQDISRLLKYIILDETNEPPELDKTYKIANPEKYFIKSQNKNIRALKERSYPINANVHNLFKEYFEENKEAAFTPEKRIY